MPNFFLLFLYIVLVIAVLVGLFDDRTHPTTRALLFVVLIVLIVVGIAGISALPGAKFDQRYLAGEIDLTTELIPLGQSGEPTTMVLPDEVPEGITEITEYPRIFEVTGCESLTVPEDILGVFAVTEQVHEITIYAPVQNGTPAVVCVAEGTASIVLWVALSN